MQMSIFDKPPQIRDFENIEGLNYVKDFISSHEHDNILKQIDNSEWLNDLKRRVQHYGYKYDYKKRNIDYSMRIGDLPSWAMQIAEKIYNSGLTTHLADQVIVNEYQVGQGISPHIDCEPCFEDTVVSLSLGSTCVMDFINKYNSDLKISKLLEPCSLVVIQGEARYGWYHGIKPNKSDSHLGEKILRTRRVSLTFRKVIVNSI